MSKLELIKKQAMETVHSHGAFGEHESYDELNDDLFASLIIANAIAAVGAIALQGADCPYTTDQLGDIQQRIKDWFK